MQTSGDTRREYPAICHIKIVLSGDELSVQLKIAYWGRGVMGARRGRIAEMGVRLSSSPVLTCERSSRASCIGAQAKCVKMARP